MKAKTAPVHRTTKEFMIGTEQLSEIIETVLFTAYVEESIPVSVILIGPSGAGKSKLVMQYRTSIGCHITSDVTSMGLQELLARDTEQKIKFIVIPDFNLVLSHRQSTLQLTIGNLLSMTSEGTIRIDDGRQAKETKHGPVGIISAMTSQMYSAIGKKWVALGFSRRFIPINYDYGLQTRDIIQRTISLGDITMLQLIEKEIEAPPVTRVGISQDISNRIMLFSGELATNIGYIPYSSRKSPEKPKAMFIGKQIEFSPHLVLRTLARAHALRDKRTEVTEHDIIFCMKLVQFTRYDQPVLL